MQNTPAAKIVKDFIPEAQFRELWSDQRDEEHGEEDNYDQDARNHDDYYQHIDNLQQQNGQNSGNAEDMIGEA